MSLISLTDIFFIALAIHRICITILGRQKEQQKKKKRSYRDGKISLNKLKLV